MDSHKARVQPISLAVGAASNVTAEEKGDLEAMLGVAVTTDWPAIRQCLRCLAQGHRIDAVDDKDGTEQLKVVDKQANRITARAAVREIVKLVKHGSHETALAAARSLAFTEAGLTRRAEWDAWWADIAAKKAARRDSAKE